MVAISQDKPLLEDSIEPLLADLDVEPAEVAVIDAPPGDVGVTTANAAVVAERFQSSGIDTVLVVGTGAECVVRRAGDHLVPARRTGMPA